MTVHRALIPGDPVVLLLPPGTPVVTGSIIVDLTGSAGGVDTDKVANLSVVDGANVTAALNTLQSDIDSLDSSKIANVSGVSGTKVTDALNTLQATKAPLASPVFTGVPTAPTAVPGTNTTQLATTAFALNEAELAKIGRIVRSASDLPTPVDNVYTLEQGLTIPIVAILLPVGYCIDAPAGSVLSGMGYQAASITGSHPTGIIRISGGSVQNLFLSNTDGGAYAAEVHFVGGSNAYLSDATLIGAGPGVVMDDTSGGALTCFNVLHDSSGGGGRSYVVKDGSSTVLGLLTCYASNGGALIGYRGVDVELGATVLNGLLLNNVVFFGGSAVDARGVNIAGVVPFHQVAGCTFFGFDGVGAGETVGVSRDTPTAVFSGSFPRSLDTRPGGNVILDASVGVAPTTTATLADTWYPINAAGATLTPDASLADTPATGEIRYTGIFPAPMAVRGSVSLEKTGGAQVRTSVRLELSSDNGSTWAAVGSVSVVDATNAAGVYVSFGDHLFVTNERLRLAINSASAGTVYATKSYTVGMR